MRKLIATAAVLIAALAVLSLNIREAAAATTTITADDVGWVQQNQPTTTHCGSTTLVSGSSTQAKRSSFQFPMSALPAGAVISAATLRIYATSNTNSSAILKAYDRDVTAFDGCSIKWSTFPPLSSQLGTSTAGVTKNAYKSIPLTTNLSSIATTGRTAITVTTQVASDLKFQSDIGANPPRLDLTYSVSPTTTTETTIMPTTTTVVMGTCQGPINITTGGTYSNICYESLSAGTPAVTISTTQAVTLDRVRVRHTGFGVWAQGTTGTNVTITNSSFEGLNPGSSIEARAVYLLQPASAIIEHNRFTNGQGVLINGNDTTASPLRVRYNDYIDIGRWNTNTLIGAIHFDKVLAPGAQVQWNRVTNHYGISVSEDVFGIHDSNGSSGNPMDFSNNLIDGSYPYTGDGAGFTGGGIDIGDGGGSWQVSHHNTVVRITNNAYMIPAGENLEHHHNRAVGSGIADSGARVSSTFGAGITVWDNPDPNYPPIVNGNAHDHLLANDHYVNLRRWNGSAWEFQHYYLPNCDPPAACTNNESLTISLTDDAAWLTAVNNAKSAWEAERVAVVGGILLSPSSMYLAV